jgi:transposase
MTDKMRKPRKKVIERWWKVLRRRLTYKFSVSIFHQNKSGTPKALIEKFIFETQNDSQCSP